ncbi:hypothetical protein INS49_013912 [Diaporthe citri]|uniref:uncharacterized protein n=1 Tax=Diaporthe citri TaxID=83186 RepID=UPI001C8217E3|nr:uncharacterized protein INS49_013912 [Diaporthe citri]KAG6358028.1 hypothetical protein INS49_013912 [Diaporthe citri]
MYQEPEFLFVPPGSASANHERQNPTHDLIYSGGSPIAPLQLSQRQQLCLRLTVNTRLFESPNPNTHYWYSRDMDWWFSAAKQVLDDLHRLLSSQSPADRSFLFRVSLCGPWRCGPWKSQVTWLSRFIHRYYEARGTVLHRFRSRVDKHLKDHPDPLYFDAFLLQCWSEMTLSLEQESTLATIERINDEAPEICVKVIQAHMRRIARHYGHQGPCVDEPWIPDPAANIKEWARLQPELAGEHRAMFLHYARHLVAESVLDREAAYLRVDSRESSQRHDEDLRALHLRAMTHRLISYIDCVIILAQREVGMVRCVGMPSGSLSRAFSSTTPLSLFMASSRGPETCAGLKRSSRGPETSIGRRSSLQIVIRCDVQR